MDINRRDNTTDYGFALRRGIAQAPAARQLKPERSGTDTLTTWLAQDAYLLECGAAAYFGVAPSNLSGEGLCAWYSLARWRIPQGLSREMQVQSIAATMRPPDYQGLGPAPTGLAPFPSVNEWRPVPPGSFSADTAGSGCCIVIGRNLPIGPVGSWTQAAQPIAGLGSNATWQSPFMAQWIGIPGPANNAPQLTDRIVRALTPSVFPVLETDSLDVAVVFAPDPSPPSTQSAAYYWPVWVQIALGSTVNEGGYKG